MLWSAPVIPSFRSIPYISVVDATDWHFVLNNLHHALQVLKKNRTMLLDKKYNLLTTAKFLDEIGDALKPSTIVVAFTKRASYPASDLSCILTVPQFLPFRRNRVLHTENLFDPLRHRHHNRSSYLRGLGFILVCCPKPLLLDFALTVKSLVRINHFAGLSPGTCP